MPRTLQIKLSDEPEDQALYKRLCETTEREYRGTVSRQVKHLLAMALGLRAPDIWLLQRLETAATGHAPPPSPQRRQQKHRPALHLVPPEGA